MEVVKGKLKVLLAGAAPHPDIKALRGAILQNDNFDLTIALPGIAPLKNQDYDVAILHQLPARTGVGQRTGPSAQPPHSHAVYHRARNPISTLTTTWAPASPSRPAGSKRMR